MKKSRFQTIDKLVAIFAILTFSLSLVIWPQKVQAQGALNLPAPGKMISLSPSFTPPIIRGMTIYPDNPLRFDFILDVGSDYLSPNALKKESSKLIKYFLASLTTVEDEMWVNLSPYEKDRIIPNSFGQTEMGRDLLAQDYMLKQLTASLIHPETELGDEFWNRVYDKAQKLYGTTEIPVNTFNKVWIVPDKARVYVDGKNVFIADSHLKVMLDEDYLALESNVGSTKHGLGNVKKDDLELISGVSSEVVRNVLIPEIEKEVNEGKTFANLRQIFHSMILAAWYKKNLKESLLGQLYINQNKIKGVDIKDKNENQKIYNQYVEAFEKGVYDFIKEDYDKVSQELIPRKYFSGGITAERVNEELEAEVISDRTVRRSKIGHIIRKFSGIAAIIGVSLLSSCSGGECSMPQQEATKSPQAQEKNIEEKITLDPKILDEALKIIASRHNIPEEFLVTPKENIESIESLNGFEVVTDAHTRMGAIVLQAGDYVGLKMAPDIVSNLRNDVNIVVLAPNHHFARILLNEFKQRGVENIEQRVRFMIGGPLSSWGRDPYTVLFNSKTNKFTLFPTRGDAGTQLDTGVGWEIMKRNIGWDDMVAHDVRDETLDLQGGDVTADDKYVYVGESTIHYSQYNTMGIKVRTKEEVVKRIGEVTGKKVVVLRGTDDIHNDRYHIPLGKTKYGENTNLLADPIATLELFASMSSREKEQAIENILAVTEGMPEEFIERINQDTLQELFNVTPDKIKKAKESEFVQGLKKVKEDLETRGITVLRVPGLPFEFLDSPFGIYPTNVVMDYPIGKAVETTRPSVIVPHYGIPKLDAEVDERYKDLGFDVRPVAGVLAGFGQGGPRCLCQTIGHPTSFLNNMSDSTLERFLKRFKMVTPSTKKEEKGESPASIEETGSGRKEEKNNQKKTPLDEGKDESDQALLNDVGGIDLNPSILELETDGDGSQLYLPFDANQIKGINIDGFLPTIINVVPNVNLNVLLGIQKGSEEESKEINLTRVNKSI